MGLASGESVLLADWARRCLVARDGEGGGELKWDEASGFTNLEISVALPFA